MKASIGIYELDVTARRAFEDRANREAFLHLMNELSIVYAEAAKYNHQIGAHATGTDFSEKADALYALCASHNLYKR